MCVTCAFTGAGKRSVIFPELGKWHRRVIETLPCHSECGAVVSDVGPGLPSGLRAVRRLEAAWLDCRRLVVSFVYGAVDGLYLRVGYGVAFASVA